MRSAELPPASTFDAMSPKYNEPESPYTNDKPSIKIADENIAVNIYFAAASWLS